VLRDPIRQKLSLFLIETAHKDINALEPQSLCAKQLSEIENVDSIIAEEIKRICEAATLAEITRILFLTARLKKTSGRKKEAIEKNLKKIAEILVTRVETESGPMKLPQSCRRIFLGI